MCFGFYGSTLTLINGVEENNIMPLYDVEIIRNRIKNKYNALISEEEKKLRNISEEEKDDERRKWYLDIKKRIIANCQACVGPSINDDKFLNRVKEISNLKKQLFSPGRLTCVDSIERSNRAIRFNIFKLEDKMNSFLKRISDEEIGRNFMNLHFQRRIYGRDV